MDIIKDELAITNKIYPGHALDLIAEALDDCCREVEAYDLVLATRIYKIRDSILKLGEEQV
jgi:hypothetical protein